MHTKVKSANNPYDGLKFSQNVDLHTTNMKASYFPNPIQEDDNLKSVDSISKVSSGVSSEIAENPENDVISPEQKRKKSKNTSNDIKIELKVEKAPPIPYVRPDQDINFCKLSEHSKDIEEENKEDNDDEYEKDNQNEKKFLSPEDLSNPLKSTSSKLSFLSDRPRSAQVRNKREEIERGLLGLNMELKRINEEITQKFSSHWTEITELRDDFMELRNKIDEEFTNSKEELHRRFTEYKGHINEILLEYKESILVIQSYVDTQLIMSRRDRIDLNILIDKLLKKAKFHDEVSKNYHFSMKNIGEIITSLLEILNINYHLQKQDEKDRESIALMGLTQNTNTIDYQKNSEIPPISLDKNCLSCSGRVTVILKAFKAACLSYSPSSVAYKGHTLTRLNLLDCINLSISELKDRLCDKNILKSELPQPLLSLNESNELDKISKLNKINGDVPWPKIEGNLPINNPKSISPRTNTERSITDSFLPITKRTKDTYSNVIKREIKKRRLNETDIKLPNLREKLNNSSGKVKINSALSSSSRKHSVVNQFTIRENYKDKPPETIILRIPELDDSPEFEDVDLLTAKRRVAKLGSNNSMRRSQSAKGSRNHETEKKLMDAP